jgi:hypothetical protein
VANRFSRRLLTVTAVRRRSPRACQLSGPVNRATMLAALGEREQALELLERESTKRSAMFSTLAADPLADVLRTDPRFQIVMKTAGMAQ